MDLQKVLFPYDTIRPQQYELLCAVTSCLQEKDHAIIHAPTGLGKTAALLAPALAFALEKKKVVFFLTSRHTQHHIAIDTLKQIKHRYNVSFSVTDLIGKKWMCLQPNVHKLMSGDFAEYCMRLREQGNCHYYIRARNNNLLTPHAAALANDLFQTPHHLEDLMMACRKEEICPYELALGQSAKAQVVVADYNYIFHPSIRNAFLSKIKRKLDDCIIIVDEGHNLPMRMRELLSHRISTLTVLKAIKEAQKYNCLDALPLLKKVLDIFMSLATDDEHLIPKEVLIDAVDAIHDYDSLIPLFSSYAEQVRDEQKTSALGTLAGFLEDWTIGDNGYARMISQIKGRKGDQVAMISKRCLDPSFVTSDLIAQSYCSFVMSGTMTPTKMYRSLLGFPEKTKEYTFASPFPPENRLVLLVPQTTTKYSTRSPAMYEQIASLSASIINHVPGNSALFFPSYALRDEVNQYFSSRCTKTMFLEAPLMQKAEKRELLERFSTYHNAVLLGISSGNFAEGIDLPGVLKCVIVVGLPLQKPDIEMQQLIAYYDSLFKKGWEYGYVFPAFSRCIQSAGRAIRTEDDRGILIFLDERFPHYRQYFPSDWELTITKDPVIYIRKFFSQINL